MADNLGVSIEKLQETVNTMRELKGTMASRLNNVSASVSNLRSRYDSPAAQNLQGIASNMAGRFAELEKEVDSFSNFLDGVIKNYTVTESTAEAKLVDVMNQFK